MRLRRRSQCDPAVLRAAADALAAAERELALAEAAHRSAYAAALARWAEVPKGERAPEDVRTALARPASADEHKRLLLARTGVEQARRARNDALRGGAR